MTYRAGPNGPDRKTVAEAAKDAAAKAVRYSAQSAERGDQYACSGDVPVYRVIDGKPAGCATVVTHGHGQPDANVYRLDRYGYPHFAYTIPIADPAPPAVADEFRATRPPAVKCGFCDESGILRSTGRATACPACRDRRIAEAESPPAVVVTPATRAYRCSVNAEDWSDIRTPHDTRHAAHLAVQAAGIDYDASEPHATVPGVFYYFAAGGDLVATVRAEKAPATPVAVVVTRAGLQALLPGHEPPSVARGGAMQRALF